MSPYRERSGADGGIFAGEWEGRVRVVVDSIPVICSGASKQTEVTERHHITPQAGPDGLHHQTFTCVIVK